MECLDDDMLDFILDKYGFNNVELLKILNNIINNTEKVNKKVIYEINKRITDKIQYKYIFLEKENNFIVEYMSNGIKEYIDKKLSPIKSHALKIIKHGNKIIYTSQNHIDFAKWFVTSKLFYVIAEFSNVFSDYSI